MIEFPVPGYDENVAAQRMIQEALIAPSRTYGVGITNVDRATLEWKYVRFYLYVVAFEKAIDAAAALKVRQILVEQGFTFLEPDPLDERECRNVFIRRLSESEVAELDNPEEN